MSREIKFRAWQTHHKEMYQPFVGYIEFPDIVVGFDDGDLRLEGEKNVILMQFTGLKDNNGKEIYEDDIIEAIDMADGYASTMYPYRGVVQYNEKECRFEVVCELTGYENIYHSISFEKIFDRSRGKVIGNIYENPELLTKAEI